MSNSKWDAADEAAKKAGGGLFVRLTNDGEKVVLIFCGDPEVREGKYNDQPVTKFAFNVFDVAQLKMRIIELNVSTYKDLKTVREKYGLDKWAFEFKRNGAKGDKKTTYSILPENKIEEFGTEVGKALAEAKLHDLTKDHGDEEASAKPLGDYDKKDTTSAVEQKTADAIIDRLKALGRDKANEFMKHFGLAKVRELPAAKAKEALEFVSRLEAPPKPADEEDPFA